ALAIDDADVAGIAIMIAVAGDSIIVGALHGLKILLELLRMPFPQLERSLLRIDELTALGGIWLGKQSLVWNLDEIHVSEILFAIRHGKLHCFRERMDVGCRVMAHAF